MNFLKALSLKNGGELSDEPFSGGERKVASDIQVLGHTSAVYVKEFGAVSVHVWSNNVYLRCVRDP